MWSTETWAMERTLAGIGVVFGMAVTGRGLISSSLDRTVRVWSTETWDCVQTVEAYLAGSRQYIRCLAVCGSTLVGGSRGSPSEVRVWDLETLRPLHTLLQPAGVGVESLVCDRREVWGAVGRQVAVRADSGWAHSGYRVFGGVGGQGGVRVQGRRYPSVVDGDVGAGADSAGE